LQINTDSQGIEISPDIADHYLISLE